MKDIFAFIGLMGTLAVIFAFIGMFIVFVLDKIKTAVRKYKYRHRFDKSPTAECYCKDCFHYNNKYFCYYLKVNTDDNGFCWKAELKE